MWSDHEVLPNISGGPVSRVGRHKFSLAEFDAACLMEKLWPLIKATCVLMFVCCSNIHLHPSTWQAAVRTPQPPTDRTLAPLSRRDSARWNPRNPGAAAKRRLGGNGDAKKKNGEKKRG